MDIKATLKPGQNGTKELVRRYGDRLVCVRYRYDKANGKRYKTVELIVDEKDWAPGVPTPTEKRVHVRIGYDELELRERVKAAGGNWNPDRQGWQVPYRTVLDLGLERRVIDDEFNP
jgi:hypothetical protein